MKNKNLSYIKYMILHKYHVLKSCDKIQNLFNFMLHDMSKFSLYEWKYYVNRYYHIKYYKEYKNIKFFHAWKHHLISNKHHWQYWVVDKKTHKSIFNYIDEEFLKKYLLCDEQIKSGSSKKIIELYGEYEVLEMDKKYVDEMIADWKSAGIMKGKNNVKEWYLKSSNNIVLHENTKEYIMSVIDKYL